MTQQSVMDAARALMPAWVSCVSIASIPTITFVLAAGLSYGAGRITLLFANGIDSTLWTERARASYPVQSAILSVQALCFILLTTFLYDHSNPLLDISFASVAAMCLSATILAAAVVERVIARRLGDPIRPWVKWFKQTATLWLLRSNYLIVGVLFFAMPDEFNGRALALSATGLAALLCLNLFGTALVLRLVGLAWPASSQLAAAVSEASNRMNVTPPAVYEIDIFSANAFASLIPRNLLFSRRALEVLSHEQLVAVCCHEIAHLAEPAKVKMKRMASTFVIFPFAFINIVYARLDPMAFWAFFAAILVATRRFASMRVRMENRADSTAHSHESDEGVYATALEQLYRASKVPAVLRYRRTHSHLFDRMVAAGVAPSYPRPSPPAVKPFFLTLAGCGLLLFLLIVAFDRWIGHSAADRNTSENAAMWRIAVGARAAPELARLGELRTVDGRAQEAVAFYAAAAELEPYSVVYRAELARADSELGRCDEAESDLEEAQFNLEQRAHRSREARAAVRAAMSAFQLKCPSDHLDD